METSIATTTREQLHFVTLTPNGDASSNITFECRGDRTAPCHTYPDCECEYWDDEHESDHPRVPHDECWMQGWFESESGAVYNGPDFNDFNDNGVPAGVSRSGPIEAEYEYDGYVSWAFAA